MPAKYSKHQHMSGFWRQSYCHVTRHYGVYVERMLLPIGGNLTFCCPRSGAPIVDLIQLTPADIYKHCLSLINICE